MDYDQLVKNWHSRASSDDYFAKFTFEYLSFIAFLIKIYFKDEEGVKDENSAVQHLKKDAKTRDIYLLKIKEDENIKKSWDNIINELEIKPLNNVSGGGNKDKKVKISDTSDWENMVEVWRSIRNNFFHGGKDPKDTRDQLLVEHGYKTLSALMELFLNGSRSCRCSE